MKQKVCRKLQMLLIVAARTHGSLRFLLLWESKNNHGTGRINNPKGDNEIELPARKGRSGAQKAQRGSCCAPAAASAATSRSPGGGRSSERAL